MSAFSFCAHKVLECSLQPESHEWGETGQEGVSVRMILAVEEASSSHCYTHDQSARLCHLTHLGGWTSYQNAAQTVLLEDGQGSPAPGLEHLSATALPVYNGRLILHPSSVAENAACTMVAKLTSSEG